MVTTDGRPIPGAQTLARGLIALREVAGARDGVSAQELADTLDVHRTIAYRMLSTLVDAGLVARGDDARYRGAVGLLELRAAGYEAIKHIAEPVLGRLADDLRTTVAMLVPEYSDAVALLVVEPRGVAYRLAFSTGSRHPLDRGAAGHALRAAQPPAPDDPEQVRAVREQGFAITFAEVEPAAWGLAVPVRVPDTSLVACLNVITYREEVVREAVERVRECARVLEQAFAEQL